MYWKNYMISYSGKDSSSYITKLKYEWDSVSNEQLIDDLTHMRVISNIELEPGYFDDYEKYLSWDKKFYNIPDYICKQVIDEFYDLNPHLLPKTDIRRIQHDKELEKRLEKKYKNPISLEEFKEKEYKYTKEKLFDYIQFHDEFGFKLYGRAPFGIEYYKDILEDFHYKES